MKFILTLLFPVLLVGLVPAKAAESPLKETDATATAQKWATLLVSSDANSLETLLASDYVHIHGTGKVESKPQFVEALRSGARKYERCDMSNLQVIPLGNVALVHGSLDVKAVTKSRTIEGTHRFTMAIAKTDQGIKVVSYQATPSEKRE